MSQQSVRPQRKAPKPSRFLQPGDGMDDSNSRPRAAPVRKLMPGFSGEKTRVDGATNKGEATGSTSYSSTISSMAQRTEGGEAAAKGQGGSLSNGAGSVQPRDDSSSSSSNSNSCEVVQGKCGVGSSSSDESDPEFRSSALRKLPPPPPLDIDWLLDAPDLSTNANNKSPGRGTPTDVGVTPGVALEVPASSSPRDSSDRETSARCIATRNRALRKLAVLPYERWTQLMLRFACSVRGIPRMSREKDLQKIAVALVALDVSNKRSTNPYMDDLFVDCENGDKDEEPPSLPSPPPPSAPIPSAPIPSAPFPEGVLLTLRNAMQRTGFSVDETTTVPFGGKRYVASDVLAVIKEQDGEGDPIITNTRRSKHCFMRIMGLVLSDKHRELFFQSRLSCTRRELDNKQTGKKRTVWVGIAEDYRNKELKVARISTDPYVSDIDQNKVKMPNATPEKLCDFFNEVKAAWNPQHAKFKQSGSHDNWRSFSGENRNVYIFGVAVRQYPTLIEVCNNLLPDDVAREYCGTSGAKKGAGSTGTAEGDRKRRADTNRRAKEASVSVGTSAKKVKAEGLGSFAMTANFKEMVASVVEAFKPEPSPASTEDSPVVDWDLMAKHSKLHGQCVVDILEEERKGVDANQMRLQILKRMRDELEKEIEALMKRHDL